MRPNPRIVLPVIVVLALAGGGYWYFYARPAAAPANGGAISASGTIESTEINLSGELGGRVLAVKVSEAETVKAGDVLVQLDPALLEAQRAQAAAAVAVAQAAEGTATAALGPAQAAVEVAQAAVEAAQANYHQMQSGPRPEQVAAAEAQVKAANSAVGQTVARRNDAQKGATPDLIKAAEARVAQAEAQRQALSDSYARLPDRVQGEPRQQLWLQWQAAEQAKDAALAALDQAKAGISADQLQSLNSAIGVTVYQRDAAQAQLDLLKAGATQDQLAAAQSQVKVAQSQVKAAQAQVEVLQAQIKAAQAQVASAQAALAVFDVQIKKLTLAAPADGVVLARAIEPGEVAAPGATLITLADLERLKLTVYVPEDRYGELRLGQTATVSVDSFPGKSFTGKVSHIADKAEFTPRNVQTADGRKTTVFAVEIVVDNPNSQLKPGMPADVSFGQ